VAGARHQDGKLLLRGGEAYRHYLETTSMVPFAAIVSNSLKWTKKTMLNCFATFAI
jgi:hypothetical protein